VGLYEDIKASNLEIGKESMDAIMIEQALNKLFYAPPRYKEELQMLKMQKQQAQQQGDRYGLHLSAIIVSDNDFCYREQVLSLFYRQAQGNNIPIGLKRIFEEGTSIGEKWQRLFIRGEIGVKEDMDISRFCAEYDLSYTPDAAVDIGTRRLVETKSQNTYQFKVATSHPSGKKQLRMYMYLDQEKRGFVLVEDKNDQNFKVFPEIMGVTFTEGDLEPYIARLERIQKYKRKFLKQHVMVDGICASSTCKRALKCNMRDACFNIGAGRVRLDK